MKKFYTKLLFVAIAVLTITATHSASALTVSPAKLEISGNPGETLTGVIEMYNEKNTSQIFYTSYENFESNDDTGTPRFIGNEDRLATWISSSSSVSLTAQKNYSFPYTITIPADAEPGGYFAALFFGNQPPQNGGQVSIGGRLGVLILLRVNGDVPESGGILNFEETNNKKFFITPPIEFMYRFSNTGGDRVAPRGDIELRNTFGFLRDKVNANPKEGSILPSTARKFVNTWERKGDQPEGFLATAKSQWNQFHFGWYTARLTLDWGQGGNNSVEKYGFFIFPWQLLLLSLIIFIIAFIVIRYAGRAYKESIVRQINKQQSEKQKEE